MRKLFLPLIAIMLLLGCETTEPTIPVTGIRLTYETIRFNFEEEQRRISAIIYPHNATNQNVTWESSDNRVVAIETLDHFGTTGRKLRAVETGTATITATTEDGNFTATTSVTFSIPVRFMQFNYRWDIYLIAPNTDRFVLGIYPANATNQNIRWESSNPRVATVDADGVVTGVSRGAAVITAIAEDGYVPFYNPERQASARGTVTVFEISSALEGVVINGVRWATRNVDAPGTFAARPEDAGMFYQWNRRVGWSSTDPLVNSNGGTTWDNTYATGVEWGRINDPCPAGWRVPTREELESLVESGSAWLRYNGIYGRVFGVASNQLFLPAAGLRFTTGELSNVGLWACYWSSTAHGTGSGWFLSFGSGSSTVVSNSRINGFSVRCVSE